MNELERMLADELAGVERGVAAPTVDIVGVTAVGRRERSRRTGLVAVAGAAAAVVATVGVLAAVPSFTGDRAGPPPAAPPSGPVVPSAPASLDELPVGASSLAPHVVGSRLHVGGSSSPLGRAERFDIDYAAGTTAAVVEVDGEFRALMSVDGSPFVELATAEAEANPISVRPSADGAFVAVAVRRGPSRIDLSLFDSGAGGAQEALGSYSYVGDGARSAYGLVNVTDDGRVLMSTDVFSIWAPGGGQPVEVAGLGSVSADQISYPRGVATDDLESTPVYGTISAEGRFEAVGTLPISEVAWSPSGRTWVVPDLGPGELEVDGEDRGPAVLPLPTDLDWQVVGWESETDVVLEHIADDDEPDTQVRCDVVALTCEQVPLTP